MATLQEFINVGFDGVFIATPDGQYHAQVRTNGATLYIPMADHMFTGNGYTAVPPKRYEGLARHEAQRRVRKGYAALTEALGPDWIDAIDLDELDVSCGSCCVIGQLRRNDRYETILERTELDAMPHGYGFYAARMHGLHIEEYYRLLTSYWRGMVAANRLTRAIAGGTIRTHSPSAERRRHSNLCRNALTRAQQTAGGVWASARIGL